MVLFADLKNYLNDSNKKIVLDFIRVFCLRLLQMGLALTTSYFLVRAISKEQFGEYHYILSWVSILMIFALPGLGDSVMQAVARGKIGTYLKAAKMAFLSSLAGTVILFCCAVWFGFTGNREMTYGFLIAAAFFPFLHGLAMWKSKRQGQGKFGLLLKLEGGNSILMSALHIAGLILLPGTILLPLFLVMFIPSVQNSFQSWRAMRSVPPEAEVEPGNIEFGLKTTAYSILSVMANHIDKILLYSFLSPVALATYMAAQKLTEPAQSVIQDLAAVLAPRFAKHTKLASHVDRAFLYISLILGTGIFIFSFTLLPHFLVLIFGEQYRESIPYCQALMCSLIIGNVANLRFRFIRSRMSLNSVRAITFGNSIFRIATSLIFIPWLGITGAIISVFLARIALAIQIDFDIKKFR